MHPALSRSIALLAPVTLLGCDARVHDEHDASGVLMFDSAMIQWDAHVPPRPIDAGGRDAGRIPFDAGVDAARPDAGTDAGPPPPPDLTMKLLVDAPSYLTRMTQTSGSGLSGVISTWGAEGYVVTAMVSNGAGYTRLGFEPVGRTTTYMTRMTQASGTSLSGTVSAWASDGYVVTAMRRTAPATRSSASARPGAQRPINRRCGRRAARASRRRSARSAATATW